VLSVALVIGLPSVEGSKSYASWHLQTLVRFPVGFAFSTVTLYALGALLQRLWAIGIWPATAIGFAVGLPVAPNLLDRHFTPSKPNQVWTADLTYIWTEEGWLYLAVVLDLFNREVVGWSLKPRMRADIVIDALTMAMFRRKPAPGLIHHSDRGSQYASGAFQARLKEYGMICSMSRKGNCWDNAPTESFFNSFKNERVHGTQYETRAEAIADAFDYIEPFYNRRRRHSTLGYASPQQFLNDWIKRQHEHELAA